MSVESVSATINNNKQAITSKNIVQIQDSLIGTG